ncbi:MAG: MmgE/PrpD family protein [Alphaproteobacteria bacterium]|nr:MmgE/PrpD family protein [Alphaproteobacteria bacterium]
MTGITRQIAEFVDMLAYDDLPSEVIARTKLLILDIAGNVVRARHDAESTPSLLAAVERLGLADGDCTVIGDDRRYAPSAAALLNGTLAHSLDFDDTHATASLHSSAPIVPAALAAAEMVGASGKDFIAAIVAGYEVQIRLGLALDPSAHYDRGFHPTATCGVFGATVAAGKLLGLDADSIESALGIALSQAAGSMQFLADGAWTKRSHVGQAAQNGLICATLAAEGFQGPREAFEGKWGFLFAYAPDADPAKVSDGLGARWETLNLAVKPYPSCRYTHAAMDALATLKREHEIDPADIVSVEIGLPETGWKIVGIPESDKQSPKSVVDGQFSMPFCAAVMLREGTLSWDHYATHLQDETTLGLGRRVSTVIDAQADALFPANMAGSAKVETANTSFEAFVEMPKGEPGNFLSEAEFLEKFNDLCQPYLSARETSWLAQGLLSLDQANSVSSVIGIQQTV